MLLSLALALASPHLEATQVLLVVDDSDSMGQLAFDPKNPLDSRWDLVRQAAPVWLDELVDAEVGAVNVGGDCGSRPSVNLPVGTPHDEVLGAILASGPHGATKLNAALRDAPKMFQQGVTGAKRIVLLSDGLNSCAPEVSSCDLAKDLHADHGIVIDVVALGSDAGLADEFQCITGVTGGTYTAPTGLEELTNIQLPTLDPLRYLVLALGLLTLGLSGRLVYRHARHALGWTTRRAGLAGIWSFGGGTALLYLVLFVGTGVVSALLGAAALGAALAWSARRPKVLALLALLALPGAAQAADTLVAEPRTGEPRFHHVLALDLSGTMSKYLAPTKTLVLRYVELFTVPGEELTLVTFGIDGQGSAREVTTFTVPRAGAAELLDRQLADLNIQNPSGTKTLFQPLEHLLETNVLPEARLEPVVLVLSDGRSDDAQHDTPFEAFAARGLYSAPGITGWKVAVAGGQSLDLQPLFQAPLTPGRGQRSKAVPLPALDPCLLDPTLDLRTGSTLTLEPPLAFWQDTSTGRLDLSVASECPVSRQIDYSVVVRRGNEAVTIAEEHGLVVTPTPVVRSHEVHWTARGEGESEWAIEVLKDQGDTERKLHPTPERILVVERSWFATWGPAVGGAGLGASLLLGAGVLVFRRRLRKEKRRASWFSTGPGSQPAPLSVGSPVAVGPGAPLNVPDAPCPLGTYTLLPDRRTFLVTPAPGLHVQGASLGAGLAAVGPTQVTVGQTLVFVAGGQRIPVTVMPATPGLDMGFGATSAPAAPLDGFAEVGVGGGNDMLV